MADPQTTRPDAPRLRGLARVYDAQATAWAAEGRADMAAGCRALAALARDRLRPALASIQEPSHAE